MKTLVICVDRDNDLGEKTGLGSPVVGRADCLKAATELGIKDPEETDTNAIFMAVKLLDTRAKEGEEAEIAILTGHKYLGEKADRTIADQLDTVLDKVRPDRAILVSDGVSDEAIMPVLQSRVKIDHVHRFVMGKYKVLTWEEKFYALTRYLRHESVRIGLGVPLTLLMIFYGAFAMTGYFKTPQNPPLGIILVGFGVYFLTRALMLQERMRAYFTALRKDIRKASVGPIFAAVAVILLIIGSFLAYDTVQKATGWFATWEAFLLFAISITWWVIIAILLRLAGAFLDSYLRFKKVRVSFLHDAMQVVAFGFITYGALIGIHFFLVEYLTNKGTEFPILEVSVYIIIGVITAIVSAVVYRTVRSKFKKRSKAKSA